MLRDGIDTIAIRLHAPAALKDACIDSRVYYLMKMVDKDALY